jgi:hypothetical protein
MLRYNAAAGADCLVVRLAHAFSACDTCCSDADYMTLQHCAN